MYTYLLYRLIKSLEGVEIFHNIHYIVRMRGGEKKEREGHYGSLIIFLGANFLSNILVCLSVMLVYYFFSSSILFVWIIKFYLLSPHIILKKHIFSVFRGRLALSAIFLLYNVYVSIWTFFYGFATYNLKRKTLLMAVGVKMPAISDGSFFLQVIFNYYSLNMIHF